MTTEDAVEGGKIIEKYSNWITTQEDAGGQGRCDVHASAAADRDVEVTRR